MSAKPRISLPVLLALFVASACERAKPPETEAASSPAVEHLDLVEMNAVMLVQALTAGKFTATNVTNAYLRRIAEIDDAGPTLNAVIETNPAAVEIAAKLDEYFANHGPKGPLHGLPVILKANIDTNDAMSTSAGSLALANHTATQDAFLVRKLREAGAVIIGKANLSEWANFRSTNSSSGWSSVGGQTRNPYVLDRNPCGSSSGSAVAVAASLAALAVGTETDGSVICPSGINGIVGIKPTLGTVSRQGIIPIAHSQDTAGPMAKTVTGAALLLRAMVGVDPDDLGSIELPNPQALAPDPAITSLADKRIGVVRSYYGAGENPRAEAVYQRAADTLSGLGAALVDPLEITLDPKVTRDAEYQVLLYEFKADLNAYLASHNISEDRDTLAELITFNEDNRDTVMPIFGQEIFVAAEATGGLGEAAYEQALETSGEQMRAALDALFRKHQLDALLAPSNGPAWKTDWVAGDRFALASSFFAAISGYPSINVPAGDVSKLPVGVSFVGPALSEVALIQIAFTFEQATLARTEPAYIDTLER